MFNIFGTKIDVVKADALSVDAEGLVIPANDHLWMGAGVGGALKKAGGEEIEIEAVKQGPATLGQVVVTKAGSAAFTKVFHAVVAGQDLKVSHESIRPAVAAVLEAVGKQKLQSVVIAPLEDEKALGQFNDAAKELAGALLDHLGEKSSPAKLVLVVDGDEAHAAYRTVLMETLGGGG
jgi:O-acetyl-ADP-ribose deacetylase